MTDYQTLEDGSLYDPIKSITIPVAHRLYRKAQQEVIDGDSTIAAYVADVKRDATNAVQGLYEGFLQSHLSRYTMAERLTFSTKRAAADALLNGSATTEQRIYLAKLGGVLNGAVLATAQERQAALQAIQNGTPGALTTPAAFNAAALQQANRIMERADRLDFLSVEAERLRDIALAEIENSSNEPGVVSQLSSDYEALRTSFMES